MARTRPPLASLALAALTVLVAGTTVARAESDSLLYELRVGSKRFDVTPDEPAEIALTRSMRVEVVLRHGLRTFQGHGIRFTHAGDMQVRTTVMKDFVVFPISRGDSLEMTISLHAPLEGRTPERALAETIPLRRKMMAEDQEAEVTVEPLQAKIAGEVREGVRLACAGGDDPLRKDWYAFEREGRWLLLVLEWRRSLRTRADALLQAVGGSLALVGAEDEAPVQGPAFVLQVGTRSYPVDVDVPFRLADARGKEREAVLVRGRKEYARHGVRFSYAGDLTVKAEEHFGRVKITLDHGQDYFASFQIFENTAIPAAQALDVSVKSVRSSVERRTGCRVGPDEACRRTFGGEPSPGTRFSTLEAGDPSHVEIHGIKVGEHTVSVLFYCLESAREQAEKAFEQIASTLKKED